MSIPNVNVFGSYRMEDLASTAVVDVPQATLVEAMNTFIAYEQNFVAELANLLTDGPGDDTVTDSFGTVAGGQFQRITDVGNMEARKVGGKWSLAYRINAYGDRFMYTQSWLDDANLADLNQHVLSVALTDSQTNITEMNRALLAKENETFDDDQWPGSKAGSALTVRALANADSSSGSVYNGSNEISLSTLNHYLVSGNASLNVAAFTLLKAALVNVGHDGRIIVLMSKTQADAAEALTGFVAKNDTNIVNPAKIYSLVTSPRARGRIQNMEVWEWPHFPDGYIFGFDATKARPLHKRVSHNQKYRGLQLVTPRDKQVGEVVNQPLVNKEWRNVFGYSVRNRVNGVAVQITTNGSYTTPTTLL